MRKVEWTEMPPSHQPGDDQDRFEMFARDFLSALGLEILQGLGRGVDRGCDLLVTECLAGILTGQDRKWLVSVKHKAGSGASVTDRDELDPIGRVRKFGADGFMAFYSTLPSSGLADTFERAKSQIHIYVWDRGRIETALLGDIRLGNVFRTYFPASFAAGNNDSNAPLPFLDSVLPLRCHHCGEDLLHSGRGLVAFVKERLPNNRAQMVDLYVACRGQCDRSLANQLARGRVSTWRSLDELRIPMVFLIFIMAALNEARWFPDRMTEEAFDKLKDFLLSAAQNVLRETTAEQRQEIDMLQKIPSFLGGLG
jgi:hypothetical protein